MGPAQSAVGQTALLHGRGHRKLGVGRMGGGEDLLPLLADAFSHAVVDGGGREAPPCFLAPTVRLRVRLGRLGRNRGGPRLLASRGSS